MYSNRDHENEHLCVLSDATHSSVAGEAKEYREIGDECDRVSRTSTVNEETDNKDAMERRGSADASATESEAGMAVVDTEAATETQ